MGYAVYHYFANGGSNAVIVRVHNGDASTTATSPSATRTDDANIVLVAANPGSWGSQLRARVDYQTKNTSDTTLFNLSVKDIATGVVETHRNLSTVSSSPRYMTKVLRQDSDLAEVHSFGSIRPEETPDPDVGSKSPFRGFGRWHRLVKCRGRQHRDRRHRLRAVRRSRGVPPSPRPVYMPWMRPTSSTCWSSRRTSPIATAAHSMVIFRRPCAVMP